MKRVRPVLVTPLLAAALLVPAAPATAKDHVVGTYGSHDQVTSTSQSDYAADGSLVSRIASTTTYDVHGSALALSTVYDVDGLPGADYRTVASNVYDGRDRLLTSTTRGYFGDGSPAGVYETRYTYDGPGDYVSLEIFADYDGDGVPEPQGRLDVTYDRQGRPVLDVDTSAEGTTGRHEWTYDNQGRRTSFVSTWYDTEGTLLERSTTRYAYPSRTDYTITTEIDYDGDGVPEVTPVESRQVG